MITFSQDKDKAGLIALYNHCFPGESDFCEWFFKHIWTNENTLIYTEGDMLLGMLHMLPTQMEYKGNVVDAAYLYALGTHSNARGKGIMSQLIGKSLEISKTRGHKLSVLITENDTLFDYYAKYGYKPAFYISKNQSQPCKLPNGFSLCKVVSEDYCNVNLLYSRSVADTLHGVRSKNHFETMLQVFEQNAWGLYNEQGEMTAYAYVQKIENTLFATECIGINPEMLMSALAHKLDCAEANWKSVASRNNSTPQGCILELAPVDIPKSSYLNLMLN